MIDLTSGLPDRIIGLDGKPILLNTDYRIWIKFNNDIQNDDENRNIEYVFKDFKKDCMRIINEDGYIDNNIVVQLLAFLYNPSATPTNNSPGNEKIIDYMLDGDYIYSAFYKTYGIDIIDIQMHWHKFQALCNNIIGEDTLLGYAKSIRGFKKSKDKYEDVCLKQKRAWTLPVKKSKQEEIEHQKKINEFDEYFAGTEYKGSDSNE